MPMNLIILGPPGAGKGTQATKIAKHFSIPHISTGQILRANKDMETDYGTPREYIDQGEYVPDEMMVEILQKRLEEPDTDDGFILDGYPRTRTQAEYMDEIADIELVIYLNVDEKNVIERLTGRRTCTGCGATFHMDFDPPADDGTCTECGSELKQREDDQEEVVRKRLETYRDKTAPLVQYYREKDMLAEVDGNPSIEEVWATIEELLDDRFEA